MPNTRSNRPLTVTCPGCGHDALYSPSNPWRPFCSERCKQADFGGWATERYRVATAPEPDDDPDQPDPAPRGPH